MPLDDAGTSADFSPPSWSLHAFSRPSTITMDENGNIAFVVSHSNGRHGVRVVRATGQVDNLPMPSPTELSLGLKTGRFDAKGRLDPTGVIVESVVLQDTKPTITVSHAFEGAYIGIEKASFRWSGTGWERAFSRTSAPSKNAWVAAADPTSVIFGLDALGEIPGYAENNPEDFMRSTGTFLMFHAQTMTIGGVVPTWTRSGDIVGFTAKRAGDVSQGRTAWTPFAVDWQGGHLRRLYGGIAWGKNSTGVVVGDDRGEVDLAGHPAAYVLEKVRRLTTKRGSAFAINSRGRVVGAVDNSGFFYDIGDHRRDVTSLDSLVRSKWHVIAAYAIASNGSILALATPKKADPRIVVLRETTETCSR